MSPCVQGKISIVCMIPMLHCRSSILLGCVEKTACWTLLPVSGGIELSHSLCWTHFFSWCPLFLCSLFLFLWVYFTVTLTGLGTMIVLFWVTCHVPASIHFVLIYHLTNKGQSHFPYIQVLEWHLSIGPTIVIPIYLVILYWQNMKFKVIYRI